MPSNSSMEPQLPAPSERRRSDRVSISFPIMVAGIDLNGKRFSEETKTTTVSRYGCCLALRCSLQADQTIRLRRIDTQVTAVGRVVAPMGSLPDGRLYGVEICNPCEGLWGIRFSSSIYEKLLDHTHDGVYFVNRDRKITYWNDGAQGLTGYSAREVVGRSCFENFLGHVDESGRSMCVTGCPLSHVMRDGQPRTAEFYLRHSDGRRVPISVRVLPIRNREGKIVGAVEVFGDATEKIKG